MQVIFSKTLYTEVKEKRKWALKNSGSRKGFIELSIHCLTKRMLPSSLLNVLLAKEPEEKNGVQRTVVNTIY